MAVTEIAPASPLVIDENGKSITRAFEILAISEIQAEALLLSEKSIQRNVSLTDAYGNTISASKCQTIEIAPKSPNVAAKTTGTTGLYLAKVAYAPNTTGGSEEPEPDGDPVYRIEDGFEEVPVDVDVDGNAIANSADEPYDPPLRAPRPTEFLIVEWIVTDTNIFIAAKKSRDYRGRTNSVAWHGAEIKEVLCHSLRPIQQDDNTVKFAAKFQYKDSFLASAATVPGWVTAVVDRGRRVITGTNAAGKRTYEPILDDDGQPITEPVPLNGSGVRNGATDAAVIKQWNLIPTADFNLLGI